MEEIAGKWDSHLALAKELLLQPHERRHSQSGVAKSEEYDVDAYGEDRTFTFKDANGNEIVFPVQLISDTKIISETDDDTTSATSEDGVAPQSDSGRSELALMLDFVYEQLTMEEVRGYYRQIAFMPKVLRHQDLRGITIGTITNYGPSLLVAVESSILEISTTFGKAHLDSDVRYSEIESISYRTHTFAPQSDRVNSDKGHELTLMSETSGEAFLNILAQEVELIRIAEKPTKVREGRQHSGSEREKSTDPEDGSTALKVASTASLFVPKNSRAGANAAKATQAAEIVRSGQKGDAMGFLGGVAKMGITHMQEEQAKKEEERQAKREKQLKAARSRGRRR